MITVNVALQKACNMSSSYDGDGFSNNCNAAVNNNSGTVYVTDNCIHTAENDTYPHWSVNLGQPYVIHSITVYARGKTATRSVHQWEWQGSAV